MKKFLVVVLGIVFTFVVLEVGLRISGFVMNRIYLSKVEARGEVPEYRILCIGNCYTAGVGAPKGLSYPGHLQRMFNEKYPGKNYLIINRGVAGRNSAQILGNVKRNILETDPDLVIVRAGSANFFNQIGFNQYLLNNVSPNTLSGKLKFALRVSVFKTWELLYRLRSVRLVSLLVNDIKEHNIGRDIRSERNRRRHSFAGEEMENFRVIMAKAREAQREGRMVTAVSSLTKAIGMAPNDWVRTNIYRQLMNMSENLSEKDVETILKQTQGSEIGITYDEIYSWVRSDVDEIVKEIEGYNVPYIIQNYPILFADDKVGKGTLGSQEGEVGVISLQQILEGATSGPPHRIYMIKVNAILRDYAKSKGTPFVDNELYFQELMKEGKTYTVGGGRYPSAIGYEFMAEKIYEEMIKQGYVEDKE